MTVRPLTVCAERDMRATPAALYRAWTSEFDRWFAAAETLAMTAEIGRPFFFEVVHEGERHPHYGRFLRLEPDRLVEITWLTGPKGTKGAETVVTVELAPKGSGTHLRLTQTGFADEESRQAHENGWRHVLGLLDQRVPR